MGVVGKKNHIFMKYNINIYKGDESNRFVLGQQGTKQLFVIGLNPSTADDQKPDPTMKKVIRFAEKNGFNGFVMLNLYPERTANPDNLPKESDCNEELLTHNLKAIVEVMPNNTAVLACWGNNIYMRTYLLRSLSLIAKELGNKNCRWLAIKLTKYGNPQHPSRAAYGRFIEFDMKNYVERLKFQKL